MKKERGSITIITIVTVLFMLSFIIGTYVIIENRRQTQMEIKRETKALYEKEIGQEEEIYSTLEGRYEEIIASQQEEVINLPSGYKRVSYIGSTGKQYINTGYNSQNDYTFEIRARAPSSNPDNNYCFLIGGDISGDAGSRDIYIGKSSLCPIMRFGKTGDSSNGGGQNGYTTFNGYPLSSINTEYKVYKVEDNSFSIDGDILDTWSNVYRAPATKTTVALFQRNGTSNSGEPVATNTGWRINYAKIYDQNGTLVRYFIPCYRVSDGVIGMYDLCGTTCTATGTSFYTNAGTSTFTKGVEVENLPSGYKQVEYIACTGTQYINTEYSNQKAYEFEINAVAPGSTPDASSFLIGGDDVNNLGSRNIYYGTTLDNLFTRYGNGSDVSDSGGTAGRGKYIIGQVNGVTNLGTQFKKYRFHDNKFSINDILVDKWTNAYRTPAPQYNVGLFSRNGNSYIGASNTGWKISYAKIYNQNGTLVRNLVACYRKSDGVIGMYDLCGTTCTATGTSFYTNAGTGTFTKGLDV